MSEPHTQRCIRVLVCGGRQYDNDRIVFNSLSRVHAKTPIGLVIHGACMQRGMLSGADRWAEAWAQVNQIPYLGVPARWDTDGRAAGPIRNAQMIADWHPDLVVGFPGGKGTAGMLSLARRAGIEIREFA